MFIPSLPLAELSLLPKQEKKNNFASFCQPTRLIACANGGDQACECRFEPLLHHAQHRLCWNTTVLPAHTWLILSCKAARLFFLIRTF